MFRHEYKKISDKMGMIEILNILELQKLKNDISYLLGKIDDKKEGYILFKNIGWNEKQNLFKSYEQIRDVVAKKWAHN